jgi:hypothetical protein
MVNLVFGWKKYIQMLAVAFMGFSFYILIKKNPGQYKNIVYNANQFIKCIPIDKKIHTDIISPMLNIVNTDIQHKQYQQNTSTNTPFIINKTNVVETNNKTNIKRSVSETKKKVVASSQNWLCNSCKNQLNAWYEIDHIIELEHGGTNDITNLVALCRECHGEKTAMTRM